MRLSFFPLVVFVASLLTPISGVQAGSLSLSIEELPESGTITFLLYDNANAFGDIRNPYRRVGFDVAAPQPFVIAALPAGEYAVIGFHDENANGELDQNFIGIPKEPLAFANGYVPRGPPSFERARVSVTADSEQEFDMALQRFLGKRGRIGVGVGVIGRSSPYRDYDGSVTRVIPAITYIGQRVQIFGPTVQVPIKSIGETDLAILAQYEIGAYEEGDSDVLAGMGDRKDTLVMGLASRTDLVGGLLLSMRYSHDVLDRIGGGAAGISVNKRFQVGLFSFAPEIGLNWLSSERSSHDFGVPAAKATADRPAYNLSETVNFELGLGMSYEITPKVRLLLNVSSELLDDEVQDSPIVDEELLFRGFSAITYVF